MGVVPYVPTPELPLLQRDTLAFESPLSYDGGDDGTGDPAARRWPTARASCGRGGALLLELGGDAGRRAPRRSRAPGLRDVAVLVDEDGDVRGIEATLGYGAASRRIVHGSIVST